MISGIKIVPSAVLVLN